MSSNFGIQDLTQKIQQLERENEALRLKLRKAGHRPSRLAGYAVLVLGAFSLTLAIVYSHMIATLIGLALAFWGFILLYITSTSFVRLSLLDSAAVSSLTAVNQMIRELGYAGKGIYLPPLYTGGVKGGTIFIPYYYFPRDEIIIPPIEEVAEKRVFLTNPKGVCLIPPGLGLVNLYENELGKDFAGTSLNYIQRNLPKVLVEDLQIAEDFEIEAHESNVHATITGSIYDNFCKVIRTSPNSCSSIGCPLCSSIALAIVRSTGKPVTIEATELSSDRKNLKINFKLLGEGKIEEPESWIKLSIDHVESLLALASIAILSWRGWIIYNDITVWHKTIDQILFGSRIGETIGLNINLKLIYYIIAGTLVLATGLFMRLTLKRISSQKIKLGEKP